MRRKIKIVGIIMITIACIYLGIRTREKNGIVVMSLKTSQQQSFGYLLETNKQKIVMIDGGSAEDSEHLEELLLQKGGVVETWFITIAHPENFGAMQEIMKKEKIEIKNIYISFNPADWYAKYEPEKYEEVAEFLDLIYSEDVIQKVYNVPLRFEVLVDNLYFTVLNVANPDLESTQLGFDQSMVIKVNNTYRSMIFMGSIGNIGAQKMKDNNLDEIDCDAVQISNTEQVEDEIYQKMTPKYLFATGKQKTYLEHLKQLLKPTEVYISNGEDMTVKIW